MKGKKIDSYEYTGEQPEDEDLNLEQDKKELDEALNETESLLEELSKGFESVKELNAHSSNVSFMDVAKYSDSRTEKERREDREFLREYRRLKLELLRRKIINCRLRNLELEYSVYGYNGQGEPEFDLYD